MTEYWALIRDTIEVNSKIIYKENPTIITNLPKGLYELYDKNQQITEKPIIPTQIPNALMNYCLDLEEKQTLSGKTLTEIVTNLEITAKKVE